MNGRRIVYPLAIIITALGMFLPLLYGSVGAVRELLGSDPLPKSVLITLLGWLIAYATFGENGRVTAS